MSSQVKEIYKHTKKQSLQKATTVTINSRTNEHTKACMHICIHTLHASQQVTRTWCSAFVRCRTTASRQAPTGQTAAFVSGIWAPGPVSIASRECIERLFRALRSCPTVMCLKHTCTQTHTIHTTDTQQTHKHTNTQAVLRLACPL